ncbi:lasso RiPP family leader peptide-containing protein [Saccharopolyspora cebuensis]|uniref:Lasso RiPP family leader peptide-containing protein n=1 Tax=Saccharopolyspora cebuensis TaxID=418759 RepID=A0ABV4CS00_9PSEU
MDGHDYIAPELVEVGGFGTDTLGGGGNRVYDYQGFFS